jgi:putative ABC transport system permease protein
MQRRNPEMSRDEFQFIKDHATLVREIGMEAFRGVKVKYGTQTLDWIQMSGVSSNMGVISNIQPVSGRFITDIDDKRRLPVVFIGSDIKDQFFPNIDPVGKIVDIDGRPFEIIGVSKSLGSVFGQSRDGFVQIPAETYFKMFGARQGLGYNALALDQSRLAEAQDEVRALLRTYRHLKPNQEDTFGMAASDSLVSAWERLTGAIAGTAVAVVSVFMVVGGVVIMNIMLAVVTERTREIGIRKSVGARSRDIMNQFLVESSMLSGTGGLIGVTIAWIVAVLVRNLTPVPMQVPISAIVIGLGLSTIVGLFFGIYPAKRAARLDPIEALRAE